MSKIKQARGALEAVELAPKASRRREVCQILFYVQHKDTILTALNALERMQGVDFDELERVIEVVNSSRVLHGVRAYYLPEDIETLENAAQTLADMKKEIE